MPLDYNAKISDIITSLEGMEGINQKAELASVIGTPATASDNIATQITKLQDAKDTFADKIGVDDTMPLQAMADALVVGKKWARGSVVSSNKRITITGFDFMPSIIIIFQATNVIYQTIYFEDYAGYYTQLGSTASATVRTPLDNINYVRYNEISLAVSATSGSQNMTYIIIE